MSINSFFNEMKTIIENGFTRNGVSFLGTGAGELFSVKDYMGTEKPFNVVTSRKARDTHPQVPCLIMSRYTPSTLEMVGSNKDVYTVNASFFLNDEFNKEVDGEDIAHDELCRYLQHEFKRAMRIVSTEFVDVNVLSLDVLAGESTNHRIRDTDLYFGEINFVVRVRE